MSICPNPHCGSTNAYVGLLKVECDNFSCPHYFSSGNQAISDLYSHLPIEEAMHLRGIPVDTNLPEAKRLVPGIIQNDRIHPKWIFNQIRGNYFPTAPNNYMVSKLIKGSPSSLIDQYSYKFMELQVLATLAGVPELVHWCETSDPYQELSNQLGYDRQEIKHSLFMEKYAPMGTTTIKKKCRLAIRNRYPEFQDYRKKYADQQIFALHLQTEGCKIINHAAQNLHSNGFRLCGILHDTFLLDKGDDSEIRKMLTNSASAFSYKFQIA